MLVFVAERMSTIQWLVIRSYGMAFSTRGLYIRLETAPPGPSLFSGGSPIGDKAAHCFWSWTDTDEIDPEAGDCAWIWHHGPRREAADTDRRLLLLPRNDIFELRNCDNTPEAWRVYRSWIGVPWSAKRSEVYFTGSFSGPPDASNWRIRAYNQVVAAGLPHHIGVLPANLPQHLATLIPVIEPEPPHIMAQYKFLLSLWGNHPFNPRLYRGLESGSLVFHQATPSVRMLDDGILRPGEHYVEIAPDLSDLTAKLQYFFDHPLEAEEIARAGHQAWIENYRAEQPYFISDVIWDRLTSQPGWQAFQTTFDVHA